MALSRFDRLLYSLADLHPIQRQQAIAFAEALAHFDKETAKLALRGAEILREASEADRKRYEKWLDEMHRGAILQAEGKIYDERHPELYHNGNR